MREAKATWKAHWRGRLAVTHLFVFLGSLLLMAWMAEERGDVAAVLHRIAHGLAIVSYFAFPLLPLLLLGKRREDRWSRPDRGRRWMNIVAIEIPLLLVWGLFGARPGAYIFSGAYLPCGKHLPSEPLRLALFLVGLASVFLLPVALILALWARRGTPSPVARRRRRSITSSS